MAPGVFVSNLPYGISEEEFSAKLKMHFPEAFKIPIESGNAKVEVFEHAVDKSGKDVQRAIIWNISVNIEELKLKASRTLIDGMKWAFHKDDGTERSKTGERMVRLNAADVRARKRLEGLLVTKPLYILSKTFMEEINPDVFKATASLYVKSTGKVTPTLQEIGLRVLNDTGVSEIGFGLRRVFFPTTLDALQTLTYLNGHEYTFCDSTGGVVSTYAERHGLELNGEMLDFDAFAQNVGYVPFDAFYEKIFNPEKLQRFPSLCWRCHSKFQLLGVDVNLTFVAGKCSYCIYDENLPIMDNSRGFSFATEQFTRLFLAKSIHTEEEVESTEYRWMIRFPAMKQFYKNPEDFRQHAVPLLQEEWNSQKDGFKDAYTTKGVLSRFRVIEIIKDDPPKKHFLLEITTPATDFWSTNNFGAIGHMTVSFQAFMGPQKPLRTEEAVAKLCTLRNLPDRRLVIVAKMKTLSNMDLVLNSEVTIVPKPIKTSYERTKYAINKWCESPSKFPFLKSFLDSNCSMKMSAAHSKTKSEGRDIFTSAVSRIQNGLNAKQREALESTKNSPFVILQGPAGTGKTYTVSVIICTLARTEKGHILSVTPSNFASNYLVSMISKVGLALNIRVLRIFARSLEKQLRATGEKIDLGPNVVVLHEAVRKHPNFLTGDTDVMISIRKKINANAEFMLTLEEEISFDSHVKQIEMDIMKKCHVFVCTADTAGDGRLLTYNGNISTLLIDEGGQLSQSHTVPLAAMKINRLIVSGDDQQLRSFVKSYSAELSGFGFSIMDWYRLNGTSVPWITLELQYRMAPAICAVASELSYNGILINDASVLEMPPAFVAAFEQAFVPKLRSTVLMYDHGFQEERVKGSHSLRNVGEMKFIGTLCQRLLQCGISPNQITVLALYDAQKKAIENFISKSKIAVNSVDSFQGRQQEVVILSMTRGGPRGIGFASRKPRLNVAVTRAKKLIIIVCNRATFSRHQGEAIQTFLKLVQKHGEIRKAEDFQ